MDAARCVTAGEGRRGDYETTTMVAHALRGRSNATHREDSDTYIPVAHALRGEGFDASEDGTGCGTPIVALAIGTDCYNGAVTGDVAATIGTPGSSVGASGPTVMSFKPGQSAAARTIGASVDVACTLESGGGGNNKQAVAVISIQESATLENIAAGPQGSGMRSDGAAFTLEARPRPQAVAFQPTQDPISSQGVSHAMGTGSSEGCATVAVAYPLDLRNGGRDPEKHDAQNRQGCGIGHATDPAPTCDRSFVHGVAVAFDILGTPATNGAKETGVHCALRSRAPGQSEASTTTVVQSAMQVRRLTPRECERLQGFPDDWTLVPYRGKPAKDGPRYKAIGNSMAVNCMQWIGERIAHHEARPK